jgi:LCP family protein required for cell wall assembly
VPRKVSARRYRRRRIVAALALLLTVGLVVLAGGWGYTAFRFGQTSSVHLPTLGNAPADGSVNLLVVGSDTRQGLREGGFGEAAGKRSDVIVAVHLVPAARHAAVLSIPRDLYVPVAGTGGPAKINSAFNRGPDQLVQTIQQRFNIPIHHYLLVNFDGFREVVDALGGVAMYFPRPVRDDNNGHNQSRLDVPRVGCQRLAACRRSPWPAAATSSTRTRPAAGTATPGPTWAASAASRRCCGRWPPRRSAGTWPTRFGPTPWSGPWSAASPRTTASASGGRPPWPGNSAPSTRPG